MDTNFEFIMRLYEAMKMYDYKPGWLYNQFILNTPNKIDRSDFRTIAKLLGYKPGWADIKYHGWIGDRESLVIARENSFREYSRDRRYSAGKDIKRSVEFD